jgi:cyclic beta-1,2-glucan synthetase
MNVISLPLFSPTLRRYIRQLGSTPDLRRELTDHPKNVQGVLATRVRRIRNQLSRFYRVLNRLNRSSLNKKEKETLIWFLENRTQLGGNVRNLMEDLHRFHDRLNGENMVSLIELLSRFLDHTTFKLPEEAFTHAIQQFAESHPLSTDEAESLPFLTRLLVLSHILSLSETLLIKILSPNETKFGLLLPRIEASIETLWKFGDIDWETLVATSSDADRLLALDPTGTYARMTPATRTAYKERLRYLSHMTGISEHRLAEQSLTYALSATTPYKQHIGYWIMDAGHERLLNGFPSAHYTLTYLFIKLLRVGYLPLLAFSTLISAGLVCFAFPAVYTPLVFVFACFPTHKATKQLLDSVVKTLVPPTFLPALDLKEDFTPEETTIFAIPAFLSNQETLKTLLSKLEVAYLGNKGRHIHFCLLLDAPDKRTAPGIHDAELRAEAKQAIQALNERYGEKNTFLVFLRENLFNPQEGVFMGWERKRGKLLEFMKVLRKQTIKSPYELFPSFTDHAEFVVVVDEDAHVPSQLISRLVSIHAHPLRRPALEDSGGAPIHGSTFVQPHVGLWFAERTQLLPKLFGEESSSQAYSTQVAETYQDLFGRGNFVGKGSIHIDAFLASLDGFFPENQVLSHDLLEGNVAGTTFANDVILYDEFPLSVSSYLSRLHRWIRGDWQTAPWLSSQIRHADGTRSPNPLGSLERYKIFDNLLESLAPAAMLGLLCIALALSAPLAIFAACLLLSIEVFSLIDTAFQGAYLLLSFFAPTATNIPARLWKFVTHLLKLIQRSLFVLGMFPYVAGMGLDAFCRALYRQVVSKRQLLEWNTASAAEHTGSWQRELHPFLPGLGLILLASSFLLFTGQAPVAVLFSVFLCFAFPLIVRQLSALRPAPPTLTKQDRTLLGTIALRSWEYYATHVSKKTAFLPPDHFQDFPNRKIANYTSVSNVGFYVVSILCAHKLGYLSLEEALERLEKTITTLEHLPRHGPLFYNWYSLKPRTFARNEGTFISSVDAGNLLACLITVSSWLLSQSTSAETLRGRVEALLHSMDFQALVSRRRLLLSVGFDAKTKVLSPFSYQTLASESRLSVLLMLAKRDVPLKAWSVLSRIVKRQPTGGPAAVSWTGTLFEYLMPNLFFAEPKGSIMEKSSRSAYANHRAFAKSHGLCGALSESGYAQLNETGDYGYKAFGVPSLALSPHADSRLVIAPYAVVLGLGVDPKNALADLHRLSKRALDRYGLLEAIDYTADPAGQRIGSYMSHHQGMILGSIVNFLYEGFLQKLFSSHPLVQTVLFLTDEVAAPLTEELFPAKG